jgi:Ca2+-binding RTX toxin-like protein
MAGEVLTDAQVLDYIASYPDLIFAFGTDLAAARQHYAGRGAIEGRTISFDPLLYVAAYPDLITAFGTDGAAAARHYIQSGYLEGRRGQGFDASAYLASNPDLVRALGPDADAAARHYIEWGYREGRPAHSFDAFEYLASNPDLMAAFGADAKAATDHYVRLGIAEGRGTQSFDAFLYLASNIDLMAAFGADPHAAAAHYVQHGRAEARTSGFDAIAYLLSNPDLGAARLGAAGALQHWVRAGYDEGRPGDALYGREQTGHALSLDGGVTSTVGEGGDRDWFQIDLAAGQKITLALTFASPATGVLGVFDASGRAVGTVSLPGAADGLAAVSFTAITAGSYYVSVNTTGLVSRAYRLDALSSGKLLAGTGDGDLLTGTRADEHILGLGGNDTLLGDAGNDVLEGGAGQDTLDGGYGDDVMYGHSAAGQADDALVVSLYDDTLMDFAGGSDRLYGQRGDDLVQVGRNQHSGVAGTILMDGGTGNDTLSFTGSDGRLIDTVTLLGGEGSDQIAVSHALVANVQAGTGDDIVFMSNVVTGTIDAGAGDDAVWIDAFAASQTVTLGDGSDVIRLQTYYSGNDDDPEDGSIFFANTITVTDFRAGVDRLDLIGFLDDGLVGWDHSANPFSTGHLRLVQSGTDTLVQIDRDGSVGTGTGWTTLLNLHGTVASSLTAAELGFDPRGTAVNGMTIVGTAGLDRLNGTRSNDHILGLGGSDALYGDAGDDVLEGGTGQDWLEGGYGDDVLYGHSADGQGDDGFADQLADSGGGADRLYGQAGDDTLQVMRDYRAGGGDTVLMDGGAGNDSLYFRAEHDRLIDSVTALGGEDNDVISVSHALAAVIRGGGGHDSFHVDNVVTGTIDADAGNDAIWLDAFATSQTVTLGTGNDVLTLQTYYSGNDDDPEDNSIFFANTITVTDFAVGVDRIDLAQFLDDGLVGWDHSNNPFTDGHLRLVQSGSHTLLQLDRDGAGTQQDWGTLVDFAQTTATDFTAADLGFAPFVL